MHGNLQNGNCAMCLNKNIKYYFCITNNNKRKLKKNEYHTERYIFSSAGIAINKRKFLPNMVGIRTIIWRCFSCNIFGAFTIVIVLMCFNERCQKRK